MKLLHIVPGLDEPCNGIAAAANLLAGEQNAKLVDVRRVSRTMVREADEVWVHSCWTPWVWRACRFTIAERKRLVRMLHGNLDPLRLAYHGWKKRLVGPIERFFLRRADSIVATCEAEKEWVKSYLGKKGPPIKVTDIKRFFDFSRVEHVERVEGNEIHLLYLGRRHPLKGIEYLEQAVKELGCNPVNHVNPVKEKTIRSACSTRQIELMIVSAAFGEEKLRIWKWCDVLVLPTLSENFGLVVAEALERGKRVITTDGAPAWGEGNDYGGRLTCLKGYRNGTDAERVQLLKDEIAKMVQTSGTV